MGAAVGAMCEIPPLEEATIMEQHVQFQNDASKEEDSNSPVALAAAGMLVDAFDLGIMMEIIGDASRQLFERGINELSKFTPEEQYNAVHVQVEKQCGWIFADLDQSDSKESDTPAISNINFSKLQIQNHPPVANVVGYVISQLNELIIARQEEGRRYDHDVPSSNSTSKRTKGMSTTTRGKTRGRTRGKTPARRQQRELDNVNLDLTKLGFRDVDCMIEKSVLTGEAHKRIRDGTLVLIEAGALVGDINDYYWPRDKYGLLEDKNGKSYHVLASGVAYHEMPIKRFAAIGAITNQCNVGLIKSCIESIELITIKNGKISQYQIEPKNGIHDEKWGARVLASQHIKLIQNDEIFNNVLMSMDSGCYGVVTRIFVRMENAYYVRAHSEKVSFKNWEKRFDEIVQDTSKNGQVCDLQIRCNPYQQANDDHESKYGDNYDSPSMIFEWWAKEDTKIIVDEKKEGNKISPDLQERKISSYTKQILAGAGLYEAVSCGLNSELNKRVLLTDKFLNDPVPCVVAFDSSIVDGVAKQIGVSMFSGSETKKLVNGYIEFLIEQTKLQNNEMIVTSPFTLEFRQRKNEFNVAWIEQSMSVVGKEHFLTFSGYETSLKHGNKLLNKSRKWFDKNAKTAIRFGKYFEDKGLKNDYLWWMKLSDANQASFMKTYSRFDKDNVFSCDFTSNFTN